MKKVCLVGAVCSALLAQPLSAQENGSGSNDDDVETIGLLSYLGLSAAEGKTTVEESGGQLEGYILASSMLDLAGRQIRSAIKDEVGAGRIAVLADDERLDLTDYFLIQNRLKIIAMQARPLVSACPAGFQGGHSAKGFTGGAAATEMQGPRVSLGLADIAGSLKTDVNISEIAISPSAQLLINAITAEPLSSDDNDWFVFSENAVPSSNSYLAEFYEEIFTHLAPLAAGRCDKSDKAIATDAKVLLGRLNALTTPGKDATPSLLEKAILLEGAAGQKDLAGVLRVRVEKAGGTLVKKQNIFTTLGINGVTMSGGLIITYRLINPIGGTVKSSGTIICTTQALGLKEINRKGPKGSACNSPTKLLARREEAGR